MFSAKIGINFYTRAKKKLFLLFHHRKTFLIYRFNSIAGSQRNLGIESVLIQKELIESTPNGIVFTDPVFQLWFVKEWC